MNRDELQGRLIKRLHAAREPDHAMPTCIPLADAVLDELWPEIERLQQELSVAFGPSLYFEIQKVLDGALGTEEVDGAGAGIVADIALLAKQKREAVQRAEQAERDRDEWKIKATLAGQDGRDAVDRHWMGRQGERPQP